MGEVIKGKIGKEDFIVQTNTNAPEQFQRLTSVGGTMNLTKFPDIWGGTGKIYVAKCATSATDPGDITEVVTDGSLTHEVLKDKINALLAAMRVAGFFT